MISDNVYKITDLSTVFRPSLSVEFLNLWSSCFSNHVNTNCYLVILCEKKSSIRKNPSIIDFRIPYNRGLKKEKNNNITHAVLKGLALVSIERERYVTYF